jgi:hypothetical protein
MPSDFNSLDGTLPTPGAGRLWFLAGRCGSWRPRALQRAKILARAAYPQAAAHTRIVSGWRVLPGSTGVITTSQVHRLRTDSGGSRLFRSDDGGAVAATARLWLTGWTKLALAAWRMKAERRRKSLTTAVNSSRQFDVVVSARRRPVASGSPPTSAIVHTVPGFI